MNNNILLKTENIVFAYDKKNILNTVNFSITNNSRSLLIGPNGAGKSTFLKVIAGLLKQDKGKIFYKNKDISNWYSRKRVKNGIVYLKQDNVIFPSFSIKDNLSIAGFDLKREELSIKIEEIIQYFPELKLIFNKRAELLSGGQRQLLGIAMILMKSPTLLLLDEPTAGLSPDNAKKILDKIEQIVKDKDISILIIEHNLAIVLDYIDNVHIMIQGKISKDTFTNIEIKHNPSVLDKYYSL